MSGELVGAGGSFTAPEGHAGCCALRVFDKDATGGNAADAPGSISEQHNVARETLDGEIFVHRAHSDAFGLGDDGVERIFGYCAATGDSGKPRAATPTQNMVDAI